MDNTIIKQGIEFVLGLDKGSEQQMRSKIEQIISKDYEIDFKTDKAIDDIKVLADAFKKAFDLAGVQIDWEGILSKGAESAFKEIKSIVQSQFTDVMKSIANSVPNINLGNVIDTSALNAERKALEKELKTLKEREKLLKRGYNAANYGADDYLTEDISKQEKSADGLKNNAKKIHSYQFKSNDVSAIKEEVTQAQNEMIDLVSKVEDMISNGKIDDDYNKTLYQAMDKLASLYEMRESLSKSNNVELKSFAGKQLSADAIESLTYFQDELKSPFGNDEYLGIQDAINGLIHSESKTLKESIQIRDTRLKEIEIELANIESQANKTVASLEEVDNAVNSRRNKSGGINKTQIKNAQDAITGNIKIDKDHSVKSYYEAYDNSKGEDFVERYKALLNFINAYEQYKNGLSEEEQASDRIVQKYQQYFDELSRYANTAKESLQLFVDTANKTEAPRIRNKSGNVDKTPTANKNEETDKPIGIMDNPMFANMFKKQTDSAEQTADAEKEVTGELEKQNKLLLYRIGKTTFDGINTDMMGSIVTALKDSVEEPYGGFGDGLFAVANRVGIEDQVSQGDLTGEESYFEIDASKYNVRINKTVEEAKKLQSFLISLQKYVLSASDFRGFDDDISGVSDETLFAEAQSVFDNFNMSKQDFIDWIKSMKQLVIDNGLDAEGNWKTTDNKFLYSHNIGTRFMQKMGYQGVVNDTGDADFDGMNQGSVIYDPDYDAITKRLEETGAQFKYVKDLLLYVGYTAEEANSVIDEINKFNEQHNLKQRIEYVDTNPTVLNNEDITKSSTSELSEEVEIEDVQFVRAQKEEIINISKEQLDTEKLAREEAEKQARLDAEAKTKAEEEARLAKEKAEAERLAREEKEKQARADEEARIKAEEEARLARERAETERLAAEEAARLAQAQAEQLALANGDGTTNPPTPGANTPAANTGAEQTKLTELRTAVEAITTAVNTKTAAFTAEEAEVARVIDSEVAKIGELESRLATVRDTISTLVSSIPSGEELGANISNVNIDTSKENAGMETLEATIRRITQAVRTKTEAFVLEEQQVRQSAGKEVAALIQVENRLQNIVALLNQVNTYSGRTIDVNVNNVGAQPADNTPSQPANNNTAIAASSGKVANEGQNTWQNEFANGIPTGDMTTVLAERIKTAGLALVKYYTQIVDAKRNTEEFESSINNLANALRNVEDNRGFTIWQQQFQQLQKTMDIAKNMESINSSDAVESEKIRYEYLKEYFGLQEELARAQNNPEYAQYLQERLNALTQIQGAETAIATAEEESERIEKLRLQHAQTMAKIRGSQSQSENKEAVKLSKAQAGINLSKSVLTKGQNIASVDTSGFSEDVKVKIDEYKNKLQELNATYEKIKNSKEIISDEDKRKLIEQTQAVSNLTPQISELVKEYERLSGPNVEILGDNTLGAGASLGDIKQQLTDMVMASTQGQASIKSFNNETGELTYTVKTGAHEFTTYTAAIRHADNAVVSLAGSTKKEETFLDAIKRKTKEISSYLAGSMSIMRVFSELKRGINYVKEIDTALTELKKVTDETEETYDKFLNTASKTASVIGSTIFDFTNATAEFARLGYSIEQASQMAEAAIVYKNVGDGISSVSEASESIISTLKAFNLEATNSMDVVSKFNEVGNNFAITSKGIGEALTRSASALNTAGNSLDESIGLITAANSVVQDPESVGKNVADIKSGYIG